MATKKDLVENITKKLIYLKEEDTRFAVDFIIKYLQNELQKGGRIEIRGFGSLAIRKRKYAGSKGTYNTVYYRMSKGVQESLNK